MMLSQCPTSCASNETSLHLVLVSSPIPIFPLSIQEFFYLILTINVLLESGNFTNEPSNIITVGIQQCSPFCYAGESGLVYSGYLDRGGIRDLVAIKTCKSKRNYVLAIVT